LEERETIGDYVRRKGKEKREGITHNNNNNNTTTTIGFVDLD
jgi:hypothetical protein